MYVDIYNTNKKYKTLYIDPPWNEQGGGKIKRGADRHYSLMKTKDILNLPIQKLVHEDGCHLYLWVTNNYLKDGLRCVEKWGFEYITLITWNKDRFGLGQYYRGITEHCIFAVTKKRLPYKITDDGKRRQGITGFYEAKTIHSRKPIIMREMIETVSYSPKLELFAREYNEGWDVWGYEAPHGENYDEQFWGSSNEQYCL